MIGMDELLAQASAWIRQHPVVIRWIKSLVVSLHIACLAYIRLSFRDFPPLDEPPPPDWYKYLLDAWAALGVISIPALFLRPNAGRWLALTFYSMAATRLLFPFFSDGHASLSLIVEFAIVFALVCFPIVFLLGGWNNQKVHEAEIQH